MLGLKRDNPMGKVLMALLLFEVVAFGLSIPVMIKVSQVPGPLAGLVGGGVALFCLVTAGLFRTPLGYPLGWLAQIAGVVLGVLTPGMYVVGGMFLLLYLITFVLGRRLDAGREERVVRLPPR